MSGDERLPDVPSSSEEVQPEGERLPEPRPEPGGLAPPSGRVEAPHAARFQFLLGALVAVALVAVGAAALALSGGADEREGGTSWSAWKPSEDELRKGAEQIAAHVGPRYKMDGGTQLVSVIGDELVYRHPVAGDVPLRVVVRRPASEGGELQMAEGDAVQYSLCGTGKECTFAKGKPSVGRQELLNREALELALYSFRYLDGLDHVVVMLPPIRQAQDAETGRVTDLLQTQALFFQRADLQTLLDQPLARTVAAAVPTIKTAERAPNATLVRRVTDAHRFASRVEQSNGRAELLMFLEPFAEQGLPEERVNATAKG